MPQITSVTPSSGPYYTTTNPVTITLAADSTGLAPAVLHGLRGGMKMIRTGSGATAGRPVKVLVFSSRFTLTQTAPGDVTVSGGGS